MLEMAQMKDSKQLNARLPARLIIRVRKDVLRHRTKLDCWVSSACTYFLRLPREQRAGSLVGCDKTVGRTVKP